MKTYIFASFDNPVPRWLRTDKRALRALSNFGVDLQKAVFHHEPIGRGKSYIAYAVRDDKNSERLTVWIPGLYNDDTRVIDPYTGNYTSIKYVPKKHLDIVDAVYIDKDTTKPERAHYQDPRYSESGEYRGQTYNSTRKTWRQPTFYGSDKYDKSGYLIPDPKKMLADWYIHGNSNRLRARLDRVYQSLKNLQSKIVTLDFDQVDPEDYSGSTYRNLLSGLGDAVAQYRRFLYRNKEKLESKHPIAYEVQYLIRELMDLERSIKRVQGLVDALQL